MAHLFANNYFIVTRATLPEAKTLWQVIERYCVTNGQSIITTNLHFTLVKGLM